MINATQIRVGDILNIEGVLYRVLKAQHITPGKGNAQVQVDIRNLKTGIKNNMRFRSVDSVEKVDVFEKKVNFLYQDGDMYHFMDPENYEQFELSKSLLEDVIPYLKPESPIVLLTHDERPISVSVPKKMAFTVAECDPPTKGMAGATKDAVMDNGLQVKVPLFIKTGESIVVDTETGDYLEKA
ncbi:MAG TPA: elongation factor P [bacterium]|nr:elongation factor P [bacterium]